MPCNTCAANDAVGLSAARLKTDEATVRKYRKDNLILPVFKQIDTLAAEFPAQVSAQRGRWEWFLIKVISEESFLMENGF